MYTSHRKDCLANRRHHHEEIVPPCVCVDTHRASPPRGCMCWRVSITTSTHSHPHTNRCVSRDGPTGLSTGSHSQESHCPVWTAHWWLSDLGSWLCRSPRDHPTFPSRSLHSLRLDREDFLGHRTELHACGHLAWENLRTGARLYFNVTGQPTPAPVLDPAAVGTPINQWKDFPSHLFIPTAGCYTLEASWPGGQWRITFAAGQEPGQGAP